MLCQKCGGREATFRVTPFAGDSRFEIQLCDYCYAQVRKGITSANVGISLSSFQPTLAIMQKRSPECESCGTSSEEFSRTGMLGCAKCYTSLASVVTPYIRRVQRGLVHKGKRPYADYAKLKLELDRAMSEGRIADVEAIAEQIQRLEGKRDD